MKKIISVLICVILSFSMLTIINATAQQKITVYVDDQELKFDVEPEVINGRTMVPFRLIFEALGAEISYDSSSSEVTAKRVWNGNPEDADPAKYITPAYLKLKIGSKTMETVINKKMDKVSLDVAPYIKNGRTLVPVRAISESFGADVYWDDSTKTVNIYSNNFFTGSHFIGSSETSTDMWREDFYHFYNGKLYFTFEKSGKTKLFRFLDNEYVWDGYFLYTEKLSPKDNTIGFDKINNKLIYYTEDYIENDNSYINTDYYYTVDFDGQNAEMVAKDQFTGFFKDNNHDISKKIIYSHPEWWGVRDNNDYAASPFTKTGEYIYDENNWNERPIFLVRFSKNYVNCEDYSNQCPAKIKNNVLEYKSAVEGTTKTIDIPVPELSKKYVDIVMQTPRYIFVKALAYNPIYSNSKVYHNGLYAIDRFEDKLYTIMTISSEIGADMPTGSNSSPAVGTRLCKVCNGAGSIQCTVCHGSGKTKNYIIFERIISCRGCNGYGKKSCKGCGGDGRN